MLLKLLVRYVFGFEPAMDHLRIAPANWMPFDTCQFSGVAHGRRIQVAYARGDVMKREFQLNGEPLSDVGFDDLTNVNFVDIPYSVLSSERVNNITVKGPLEE